MIQLKLILKCFYLVYSSLGKTKKYLYFYMKFKSMGVTYLLYLLLYVGKDTINIQNYKEIRLKICEYQKKR